MIRDATIDDLDEFIRLSIRSYKASKFNEIVDLDEKSLRKTYKGLLENPKGIVKILDIDGQSRGVIGSFIIPFYLNYNYHICQEIIWWIDPEYRGHGKAMLEETEKKAKVLGAKMMVMVSLESFKPKIIERFYKSNNYILVEHNFVKELN